MTQDSYGNVRCRVCARSFPDSDDNAPRLYIVTIEDQLSSEHGRAVGKDLEKVRHVIAVAHLTKEMWRGPSPT